MACLIGLALVCATAGIAALTIRAPTITLHDVRPMRILRGCLALLCLLFAVAFVGIGVSLDGWPR
jgi:hypothetical protein